MSSSPAVLVIGASGAIGSPLINDLGPVMATVLRDLKQPTDALTTSRPSPRR